MTQWHPNTRELHRELMAAGLLRHIGDTVIRVVMDGHSERCLTQSSEAYTLADELREVLTTNAELRDVVAELDDALDRYKRHY